MRRVKRNRFEASRQPRLLGVLPSAAPEVQQVADRAYEHLKKDPRHLASVQEGRSVLVSTRRCSPPRARRREASDGLVWFWIGTHADYDKLLG